MHGQDQPQRTRGRARGFTLIEVLLVIALIAVLGGLGGGVYVGTYKRLLVEKTARQFFLMARYARIMAISQQRPYDLLLTQENKGFLLATTAVNPATGQMETVPVQDLYCRPVEFEGDVRFEDVRIVTATGSQTSEAGSQQQIVFLPNGSAQAAVVQIGDGTTHYTVAVVAATGKASLYDGPAANAKTASIDLDLQQE
jgi:type II secretion system protein H